MVSAKLILFGSYFSLVMSKRFILFLTLEFFLLFRLGCVKLNE